MAARLREGLRFLVPPSRPGQDVAGTRLKQLGASVLGFPAIQAGPQPDPAVLARELDQLEPGDWILVSGKPSAEAILEQRDHLHEHVRFAVIGTGAQVTLRKAGLEVKAAPKLHTPKAITQELGALSHRRVLLVRASRAGGALPNALWEAGATILEAAGYALTVHSDPHTAKEVLAWPLDAVILANPTAADVFADGLEALGLRLDECFPLVPIIAIGPETARAARDRQIEPDLVAEGRVKHLVQAITALFGSPNTA